VGFRAFEGVCSVRPTPFSNSAATRAPAGGLDAATSEALDRVLAWVTSQKGLEWISV
jgi:hypothetical protein